MTEYITLLGAEQVHYAGNNMREAATGMNTAASNITYVLENHQRWMDDWLSRFQQILEDHTRGETRS